MKIFKDNKVYVQKNDVVYLNSSDEKIPVEVYIKLFENGAVIIGDHNRYDFVEYEGQDVIDFFREVKWIIDYDEIKSLTDKELEDLENEIAEERDSIATVYNAMTSQEKIRNSSLLRQAELLKYKIMSLRDFRMFKLGGLKITFPEGVEYEASEEIETEDEDTPNRKNGFKQMLKSLFRKEKK